MLRTNGGVRSRGGREDVASGGVGGRLALSAPPSWGSDILAERPGRWEEVLQSGDGVCEREWARLSIEEVSDYAP